MSSQPRVLIVIVNYKGAKDTIECLEGVSRLSYTNYQVLLCDNYSNDGSIESIYNWSKTRKIDTLLDRNIQLLSKSHKSASMEAAIVEQSEIENIQSGHTYNEQLLIIPVKKNLGFAGANNIGLKYALSSNSFDYVWLLNNDTLCQHDSLQQMVNRLDAEREPATCGSRVMHYFRPDTIQALGGARFNRWTGLSSTTFGRDLLLDEVSDHRSVELKLDFITGCSWLVPLDFVRTVGLMQEDYFLYFEEIDWCMRAKKKFKHVYAEDAVVYHKEGASIGSPSGARQSSLLSDFYIFRNKLKVIWRFNPVAYPLAWLITLLQSINRIRQGHPQKALLIFRILLGKRVW